MNNIVIVMWNSQMEITVDDSIDIKNALEFCIRVVYRVRP